MIGALRSHGIVIPRQRVMESMRHIDPLSQIIRCRVTTRRTIVQKVLKQGWDTRTTHYTHVDT